MQVYFFKIYLFFLRSRIFKFVLFFFAYVYAKTIQKSGNFYDLSFLNSSDLGFENKYFFCSFWLIFCPLNPDPHIFGDPESQNLAENILSTYNIFSVSIYQRGCKLFSSDPPCKDSNVKITP